MYDYHVEQSILNEPIRSENCLNDSDVLNESLESYDAPTRSRDLDYDTSSNLDHDESLDSSCNTSQDLDQNISSEAETSCEHNNTHLEDNVAVEDIEVNNDGDTNSVEDTKGFQCEFTSLNFTTKVCECVTKEYSGYSYIIHM